MTSSFRPCVIIPTYDNPRTVAAVVEEARTHVEDVLVVDDGSGPEGRRVCAELESRGLALLKRHDQNGGKGAAVKTGLAWADSLGFTHAVQVDADGQHDLSRIPDLLAHGRAQPEALILGCPEYDETAPAVRQVARKFTQLWIDLEVGRGVIADAMVGFRLYPIRAALEAQARGDRMDFDVEIPVRMAWRGTPIVNMPVGVRYLSAEEGGVSHFQPLRDNLRFSSLHARLTTQAMMNRILGRTPGAPLALGAGEPVAAVAKEGKAKDWLSVPERGSVAGIFAVAWIATALGRAPVRLLVAVIAFFYARDRRIQEASRGWWRAVDGEEPSFWKVYGHVRRFANVSVDRLYLLAGRHRGLRFRSQGNEHLEQLAAERRGAILLGAHLGSFEAMRLRAKDRRLDLNIVGNFDNARMVNAVLARSGGAVKARVIEAKPGDVQFVFDIQARLGRGELVAILGDRVAGEQSSVVVDFFGRPARFPTGPFVLASLLKCPIYLTFGLFYEPNRYELSCEPFAESLMLPRKGREEALRAHVQRYAERLEAKARAAPDNWFNFFDFWEV